MNFSGVVRVNRCGLIFVVGAAFIIILYAFSGGDEKREGRGFRVHFPFTKDHGKVTLKEMLVAAVDVAQRGGLEVVDVRKNTVNLEEHVKGKTKEGVKDSATEGDFRSHKVMFYGIRKAFPGVKVISEEHTENPSDFTEVPIAKTEDEEINNSMMGDDTIVADDVVFWIDPLDATKEYTENLIQYVTTMVGVAVKGKPILGVIHKPFTDETFWAVVGHGHSPNFNKAVELFDSELRSEDVKKPLRLIVSRSHAGNVQNFTQTILGTKPQVISAAGAGYKVIEVIEDKADAYVHVTDIKKWDLCAGYAILTALGGSMTTLNGESIDFSGDTGPLNTNGILAYMKSSPEIDKLKLIKLNNQS